MVLAYSVILFVLVAVLLKRDLSGISRIPYRGGWQAAVVVVGLFVLQAAMVLYVPGQTTWQMLLLILSQVALLCLILLNRHVPGAKFFAIGVFLNILVMVANGGWMPVSPETYQFVHPHRTFELQSKPPSSKNIILARSETRLWALSDIIPLSLPWRRTALSIGDVLLLVGAAQFIFLGTIPAGSSKSVPRWSTNT